MPTPHKVNKFTFTKTLIVVLLICPTLVHVNCSHVARVNEPPVVGCACCSLLEQLQQAVKNTGTLPDLPIPHSPESSFKTLLSFLFFGVLNLRIEKMEGARNNVYVYMS